MDTVNTTVVSVAAVLITLLVCTFQTMLGDFGNGDTGITFKQRITTFPIVLWSTTIRTPYILMIVGIALGIILWRQ